MTKAEKFIESIKVENFNNELKNGGVTYSEKMSAIKDYSTTQEKKDLESFKFYMNTSAYDQERKVYPRQYRGDEER